MIDEKTLEWKYYLKKLPLYLQNSYGFKEHFKMLFEIMLDTNRTATDLLRALDLTAKNYYSNLDLSKSSEETDKIVLSSEYTYDLLDKMASLYGVNRYLDVDYVDYNNQKQHQSLKLTNDELLKLILVKVVQNSYTGTYENMRNLYNLIQLPIYLYNDAQKSGNIYCIFDDTDKSITNNLRYLFYADLLSIKSIGIKYNYRTLDQTKFAEWDADLDTKLWNIGVWS